MQRAKHTAQCTAVDLCVDAHRGAAWLCCVKIAPLAACQLVESSTDPDGGWHTKAHHPIQRVASNLCFDPLTGQNPSV